MRSFAGRDILSLKDFERQEFFRVFDVADRLKPIADNRQNSDLCADKTLVTMHRLGGHVTGFSDAKMTRAGDFYQESIKDTIKMLEFYGDVIVMRHFQKGAPQEAAKWASIPIINGGDGWGEHPTQILTDLYTVYREKGRLDGLKWVAIGDMRMRTMHSLGYALTQFDCPITFVGPTEMSLPDDYKTDFNKYSLNFKEADHVADVIADADVILVEPVVQPDYTKSRDDRDGDVGMTPANYKITRELLTTKAKSDAILLHSLPRMDEIPPDVDITRWSRYWQEAYNGVVMRMALIALVLGKME
ncbi:MAG: aspartate carbamoyltransferase [Anaerolineaceae bacterium 4572_5.2]|nr:MAG: aspartate carbamoyltransferase [Anaerolineaceae bacterium 4572_5.2]